MKKQQKTKSPAKDSNDIKSKGGTWPETPPRGSQTARRVDDELLSDPNFFIALRLQWVPSFSGRSNLDLR